MMYTVIMRQEYLKKKIFKLIGSGHISCTIIHMYNENALNIMIITCDAMQIDKKLLTWEDIFD